MTLNEMTLNEMTFNEATFNEAIFNEATFNEATFEEMSFGDWIVYFRKQQPQKMTQRALAKAAGLPVSYVGNIECDRSPSTRLPPVVSDAHLRSLAAALGVSEEVMFSRAHRQGQEQS